MDEKSVEMGKESEYKAIRDYMKNDSVDEEQQCPQRLSRVKEREIERNCLRTQCALMKNIQISFLFRSQQRRTFPFYTPKRNRRSIRKKFQSSLR